MSFLNSITSSNVLFTGFILAGLSLIFLHGFALIGYVIGLTIAILASYYSKLFNWLSNFADPKFWPTFVGLGVAILFAAYTGGLFGLLACIGPLVAYDGMYFNENY